jgi:hypothetical protein
VGDEGLASLINVGSSCKCVDSFALRPLYLQYIKWQGRSEVWSGDSSPERNFVLLSGIIVLGLPARNLVPVSGFR